MARRLYYRRYSGKEELAEVDLDPDLVFETMSGMMLYALIFPPASTDRIAYVPQAVDLLVRRSTQTTTID